jgi:hypothetical protein
MTATSLASVLPQILSGAIAWAQERERNALATGGALAADEIADAKAVGVLVPEKIRVVVAPSLPLPDDPWLREVALSAGLLGPGFTGLTLGYAKRRGDGYANRPRRKSDDAPQAATSNHCDGVAQKHVRYHACKDCGNLKRRKASRLKRSLQRDKPGGRMHLAIQPNTFKY